MDKFSGFSKTSQEGPLSEMRTPWSLRGALIHNVVDSRLHFC